MVAKIALLSIAMTVFGVEQIAAELSIPVRAALLHRRQTGTSSIPAVPAGCESTCDPVNTAVAAGCTPSACCQPSFEMGFFNCFECVGNATHVTDFSEPQQDVDALVDTCAALGFALPKLTFPGQNPNRTISSVASSKASTAASSSTLGIASQITISDPSQTSLLSTTSTSQLVQSTVTSPPSDTSSANSPASPSTTSGASSLRALSINGLGSKVAILAIAASLYFGL
ncbi:hypothetical protein CVT26_005920 [Gymnopilus dilepis]|uniref:Extracellular membrane protein CFEM domain-containing protein n=1 Tax=Gymnopilus dilepis TaxID=231916 RepID=A0A409VQ49_9AGAR|nr:hypothetical protein CVT26_005920 [Gymnopilus dilepis]